MPVINVNLVEGRSTEEKESLIYEITEALQRVLNVPKESVRVILHEVDPQNYGIGGISKKKKQGVGLSEQM